MVSIRKLYDEKPEELFDLINRGQVKIHSDGTMYVRCIPFSKLHMLEIKEILPWYVILYIHFRVYKWWLSNDINLDFHKGLFKSWLTSENIEIRCGSSK